jgi:hypothetical protein
MPPHSDITQQAFLKVSQVFNWATKNHYVMWFTGERLERHRRIEVLLKRLSDSGRLRVAEYGHKLVYISPKHRRSIDNFQIIHGLGVTEGLVRLMLADRSGIIVPERKFKTKTRPEFGIVWGEKTLLYEYCTKDNAKRFDVLKRKLNGYSFLKPNQSVLFVMNISREEVKETIKRLHPEGPFLFTDLTTFMSVPLGEQLTAKIYLWEDLNEYRIRPD